MNLKSITSRISILDLGAMDRDLIREIIRPYGYKRLACYGIAQDNATLLLDTGMPDETPAAPRFSCSSYYYTAKSRPVLASGWQPVPQKILDEHPNLKGWKAYLPVQDLWTSRTLFLVKKDGRKTGESGELDGFLEALGRRFHYWLAGDELRHFIDDTTSHEHTHAFSNMLSQILSHEIRNPVTNLLSLSQTHEFLAKEASPDQAIFAAEVGEFANQIWTVIQKIEVLMNSDQSQSSVTETAQLVDMRTLLESCVAQEFLSQKGSTLKPILSMHDSPMTIQGIPTMMTLAIRELLKNAFQYANGTPVKVSAYPSGTSLIIDIEEDGVAILPGHEEMIFLRYFQGPKNSAQKGFNRRGLGLGLFVARFVSSAHAGQLLFVRGVGKKGTFRMILPLFEGAAQSKAS